MKKIAILGSTGSIGRQTLNVIRRNKDLFKVVALSAGENGRLLKEQVEEFAPKTVTLSSNSDGIEFKNADVFVGEEAYLNAITEDCDLVVIALVGFMGLKAVLKAVEMKKDVALANKESLVVGGELVMKAVKENGVNLYPIDSEHSAIWQCLNFDRNKKFKKLIITASGGAFRDKTVKELDTVTAEDALKHPNWTMGAKITVDCATMVNKAFEVIEARWLYDTAYDNIKAVMHRESIIHSMVEFEDNSVMAEMSYPTMEIPIALAIDSSLRLTSNVEEMDLFKISTLHFEEIDSEKFPLFSLIVNAGKRGGLYPAVANGANEIANLAFREGKISFKDIYSIIKGALSAYTLTDDGKGVTFENLKNADTFAREYAKKYINGKINEQ